MQNTETKQSQVEEASSPTLTILLLYLFPILAWIGYTYLSTPLIFSWFIALGGLAILCLGTALLSILFRVQDAPLQEVEKEPIPAKIDAPQIEIPAPIIVHQESPKLLEEIQTLKDSLSEKSQALEKSHQDLHQMAEEYQTAKDKLKQIQEELATKQDDKFRKIEDLELAGRQKQETIQQLENQIHDLRYEIKTLLSLTEVNYASAKKSLEPIPSSDLPLEEELFEDPPFEGPVTSEKEAELLLKRCVHIAEKMKAGYRASTLRSISSDPYAFDLRRLSDALHLEEGALISVYSPKDERILFANKETKNLLGWSPENFIQDFSEIADFSTWKNHTEELLTKKEVHFSLKFQTKSDEPKELRVLLGAIPSGIFRSLILAIIY